VNDRSLQGGIIPENLKWMQGETNPENLT
jgi:hypothetical protein